MATIKYVPTSNRAMVRVNIKVPRQPNNPKRIEIRPGDVMSEADLPADVFWELSGRADFELTRDEPKTTTKRTKKVEG